MQYAPANAEGANLKMWRFIMEVVIKVNLSTSSTRLYLQSLSPPFAFGAEKQNE